MSQHVVLRNAAVPRALVADAAGFGGTPRDDCLVGDLQLVAGQVAGMHPRPLPPGAEERFLRGQIVLPRLTEVHCHLDKCHTVARLAQVGGDLQAAIAAQHADKARWSQPDILRRATRGLTELQRAGVALARTHVDWEPDDVAQRLQRNNPLLSPDKAAWLAPHWAQPGPDGRWHLLGDAAHKRSNPVLYRVEEHLAAWRAIEAPLLWVEGDRTEFSRWWGDRYTKAEFHERLSQVRQVDRHVLSPCGHMVHHDQPQALAALLRAFLDA